MPAQDVPKGEAQEEDLQGRKVSLGTKNVKTFLQKNNSGRYVLPKKATNPFPYDYAPKESASQLLDSFKARLYMHLFGIL